MRTVTLGSTGIVTPQNAFGALPSQRVSEQDAVALLRRAFLIGKLRHSSAVVCENILFGPAREIEQGTVGKEIEAGLGEFNPAFADQALVQFLLECVKVADVARRIFALRVAQLRCAPVAGLLLLRDLDAQQPEHLPELGIAS